MSTQLDLTAIRRAVAGQIAANVSKTIRCYAFRADAPVFPAAVVMPSPDRYVGYHQSFGLGASDVALTVQLMVQRGDARSADEQLDAFLSSGAGLTDSVVDAIGADRTLGGQVADTICTGARMLSPVEWPTAPGAPVIVVCVAELDLMVRVRRS